MLKRWFLNVLVSFLSLAAVVLVCDFLIQKWLNIPSKHQSTIVVKKPHQVPTKRLLENLDMIKEGLFNEFDYHLTTDAEGFRNAYRRKDGGDYELIFLGDSQTFGVGVSDSEAFPAQVGRLLDRNTLNAACPGYNTIEAFQLARSLTARYKPRYFVLCFFAGNDPYENFVNEGILLNPGRESVEAGQRYLYGSRLARIKNWLAKNSSLYNLLRRLREHRWVNRWLYRRGLLNPLPPGELAIFSRGVDPRGAEHWAVTERYLKALADLTVSQKSQLLICLIPDRYQVEDAHWKQWVEKYLLNEADYDRQTPNRRLEVFCRTQGIAYLDLTPALRDSTLAGQRVYWAGDSHLNHEGQRVVAQQIAAYLDEALTSAT